MKVALIDERDYDNVGEALDYFDWYFDTDYDKVSKNYWNTLSNFIEECIQKFGSEGEKKMGCDSTISGTCTCGNYCGDISNGVTAVDSSAYTATLTPTYLNQAIYIGDYPPPSLETNAQTSGYISAVNRWRVSQETKLEVETEEDVEDMTPRRIIRNGPATVVFWNDDTKTVVMRKKGEKDDPYYAFCAALAKKIYGTNSHIKRMLDQVTVDDNKKNHKNKK